MRYLSFIILVFIFNACSSDLSPGEYISWIEDQDNGLLVKKEAAGVNYQLQYEPAAYKALKRVNPDKFSKATYQSMKERYKPMHHFLLKVSAVEEQRKTGEALPKYLAYDFQEYFRFIQDEDTIKKTVMYHLESSAGVSPWYKILLAYPKKSNTERLKLEILKNELHSKNLGFSFETANYRKAPGIKFSKK